MIKKDLYDQIIFQIKNYEKIICLHHKNFDGDAIGSSFAIKNFIQYNFPNKKVFIDGEQNSGYLSFLGEVDYLEKKDYENALIIVSDTANWDRIDSEHLSKKDNFIIKIDHHLSTESYGNIEVVDSTKIANCHLVYKILEHFQLPIPKSSRIALFTGIITDSNRFLFPRTNWETFAVASSITKPNLDIQKIFDNLYISSLEHFKFKNHISGKLEINGSVGFSIIKKTDIENYNINMSTARSFVNVLSGIKEVKIWLLATEDEDSKYKISIRSRKYNINKVAKEYSGGGHKLASACWIDSISQLSLLLKKLNKVIEESDLND